MRLGFGKSRQKSAPQHSLVRRPKQKRLINELPSLVHPKGGWPFDSSHRLEVIILWTSFYVDIFHPGHPGFVFFLSSVCAWLPHPALKRRAERPRCEPSGRRRAGQEVDDERCLYVAAVTRLREGGAPRALEESSSCRLRILPSDFKSLGLR